VLIEIKEKYFMNIIKMYDLDWFRKEPVIDITVDGQQYSIFYNPIEEEFFVYKSHNEKGKLRCKNVAVDNRALEGMLNSFLSVDNANQTITIRKFLKEIAARDPNKVAKLSLFLKDFVKKEEEKASDKKVKLSKKGRPSHPYLREAALWAITNKKQAESKSAVIERAYENYKEESPNNKAFTNSVNYNWKQIEKEYKEWQQRNVTKNTDPLEIFAKKKLRKLKTLNKNKVQK
jgi:hypothetical protein